MSGKFVHADDIERESLDWGGLGWISRPSSTGSGRLTVLDVTLAPGHGHDFHKHADQEEVIVVQSGEIEQWLEGERTMLVPGEAVFIGAGTVHASF
ncbi:MAG: cupin domain-containing protein, partial [Gaiellaceae bacterium]